jgi:serine/threonine protein kinase
MNVIFCTQCGRQNPAGSRFCSGCGGSLQDQHAASTGLTPGTRLRDRYIIRRLLGQGGFGRTYLSEDTGRFNEQVALKEFTPSVQGTYALQKAEELFQREAATLHRLQHPQIPRFWEIFQHQKRLFLVEDYVEGHTYQDLLQQYLQQGKTFSEAEILQMLRQLLPVLSYLHRQGVIHRDISPDNIILSSKTGVPVLIDLGGVKQAAIDVASQIAQSNNPAASSGTRLGKIGYAPDEQLRMGIVAPHSDLYALAVTAIVLMTGKQPQELIDPYTMNWIWNQHVKVSSLLANLLNRMLAKEPYQRFQSADEILAVLAPKATVIDPNQGQGYWQSEASQSLTPASMSKRFFNYILDGTFYLVLWIILFIILFIFLEIIGINTSDLNDDQASFISSVSFLMTHFLYYLTEMIWGKSIAKFITKTKVVTQEGKKPGVLQIIGRTLARLVPFDAFSFLFASNSIGWHDSLSGTRVVDDQR